MRNETDKGAVNVGRHRRSCKICAHSKREEIEQGFVTVKAQARGQDAIRR